MQLVQNRSSHLIRYKSLLHNLTGETERADRIKALKYQVPEIGDSAVQLSLQSHIQMIRAYNRQIKQIEKALLLNMAQCPELDYLKTAPGIGDILALTILLETGDINRFKGPCNFASYCRCVDSRRESNGKKKGENNRKNGNRYLAWAFIEAATFAIRHSEKAKRYYQKKSKATHLVVARKALAHKLARACYWIIKKQAAFDETLIFG
jgi:transposase